MKNRDLDLALCRLAERQHGVVSRSQARLLGADRWALRRRLASGAWEAPTHEVLRLVGSRRTFRQRAMTAVLLAGEGAVISGVSAARLWGLPGFTSGEIEVSRHRHRHRHRATHDRRGAAVVLHRPRLLPEHHCGVVEGIPVTTVARTVFDLAARVHPWRAERALDNALSRKLVELETLRTVTIELLERGRTGSALMRRLLLARGVEYIPPESGLEARFLAVVADAGIEAPECQVDLGEESWIGRVDHYFRRWRIVCEVDGPVFHTSKLDREADERRDAALRAAGFEVLRFTEEQVWERPAEVVEEVRTSIAAAALVGRLQRTGSRSGAVTATIPLPER